jgi:uncharacterized protein YcbX
MIRIERIYYSPVKSLGLSELTKAHLDKPGIPGDRAFVIIDEAGKLVTQREVGSLVQIKTSYDAATGALRLAFPDGSTVHGVPQPLDGATSAYWGDYAIDGHVVDGEWSTALSDFAKQPLRLMKAAIAGKAFDAFPISMCSTASLDALAQAAGQDAVDGRRFRQNIYLSGATPHQEDEWIGSEIRVGKALVRVKMADPRCVMTTHSPDTGEIDMNTLKLIASYRTDQPKQTNFGVYCTVVEPGEAAVGDHIMA